MKLIGVSLIATAFLLGSMAGYATDEKLSDIKNQKLSDIKQKRLDKKNGIPDDETSNRAGHLSVPKSASENKVSSSRKWGGAVLMQ